VPQAQELWRILLRAEHASGGRSAAEEVADQMAATFAERGIEPEQATVELLDQTVPTGAGRRSAPVA
jgi:DNA-binding SARP family transcriptional activator